MALAIGGCTVAELKGRISEVEFAQWQQYYLQNPFDDHHRYHRPAALISAQLSGLSITDALSFTENKPSQNPAVEGDDVAFQSILDVFGPLAQA